MTNKTFVEKLIDIAKNYKTLYVMSCFGAPMTARNKARYIAENAYNSKSTRKAMINAASVDTFGFDCVCVVKGVLWGWTGDKKKLYGGAVYKSNGVPDIDEGTMISVCNDVSSDFSKIEVGEMVWIPGHMGVYIGDGLVVECTPKWDNKVQITALGNVGSKAGYNTRTWAKHGKLPYISYEIKDDDDKGSDGKTNEELAQEVMEGKWGNNPERKNSLIAAGHDYVEIQRLVNKLVEQAEIERQKAEIAALEAKKAAELKKIEEEKAKKEAETLKVGDRVRILARGNANSLGTGVSTSRIVIGWERTIIEIKEGRVNPYRVGNSTGTTGWFKKTSLEKI